MAKIDSFEGFVRNDLIDIYPFYSYLYTLKCIGCIPVSDSFEISRDASYHYVLVHYVYGGEGSLIVNQTHYKLGVGDCFILGPGKPHIYASEESSPLKVAWLEFYGSNTLELMNVLFSKDIHVLHPPYSDFLLPKLLPLFDSFTDCFHPSHFMLSEQVYSLILALIEQGLKSYEERDKSPSHLPVHIERSLKFIETNLSSQIKVHSLAESVNCSPSYFSKSFTHHIGISPYKYILIKKIEYALIRILNDDVTATGLAEELGFVDTTHFTKVFKKVTGQSMSNYKKSLSNTT